MSAASDARVREGGDARASEGASARLQAAVRLGFVIGKALMKRNLIELRRYPVNLIGLTIGLWSVFLVIYLGLRAFAGREFTAGDSPSVVGIGFVLFFLMLQSYSGLTEQLTSETLQGTLEQLAMSRVGLLRTLVIEFFVNAVTVVPLLALPMVAIMATTGRWLHVDPLLLPLAVLTMCSVAGLGLALGGLTVVFKRIQGIAQFLQIGFLAMLAAPVDRVPALKALPVSLGYRLIRDVMIGGTPVYRLPIADLGIVALTAVVYLAAGAAVFAWMDRKAREHGLLGQY